MKLLCIIMSIVLLFAGCFTQASITKDVTAPDDTKVFFYLRDGSYVRSYSGRHHRIDSGYTVSGDRFSLGGSPKKFEDWIGDSEITRMTRDEFNWFGTFLGIGFVAPLIVGIVMFR